MNNAFKLEIENYTILFFRLLIASLILILGTTSVQTL